jgi:hypothetical protein
MPRYAIHRPSAAVLGVPREWKLDQSAALGAVKIGPDMVSGAHDIVDPQFLRVDLLAGIPEAPAALVIAVSALHRGVPGV